MKVGELVEAFRPDDSFEVKVSVVYHGGTTIVRNYTDSEIRSGRNFYASKVGAFNVERGVLLITVKGDEI